MARSPTNDEVQALRAFHCQVERLRQCSIVKQGKLNLSLRTHVDMVSGEATLSFTGYDPELLQAALPVIRQFFLKKDAINFKRVHNIINKCCDRPDLVGWTRYARRKWDEKLASLPDEVHRHFHVSRPTVDDAIKKLFYGRGGLFHVDINAPEEDKTILTIQQGMLHHALPFLCWCLNAVDSVIYWWLDAPGDTVPAVPTT